MLSRGHEDEVKSKMAHRRQALRLRLLDLISSTATCVLCNTSYETYPCKSYSDGGRRSTGANHQWHARR